MDTEIGKIAIELSKAGKANETSSGSSSSKTPLQRSMAQLAYILFVVVIILAVIVFATNEFQFTKETLSYAVSLGVAVIPEGLIAVVGRW